VYWTAVTRKTNLRRSKVKVNRNKNVLKIVFSRIPSSKLDRFTSSQDRIDPFYTYSRIHFISGSASFFCDNLQSVIIREDRLSQGPPATCCLSNAIHCMGFTIKSPAACVCVCVCARARTGIGGRFRKWLEIEVWFQWDTNRKWHMADRCCHMT